MGESFRSSLMLAMLASGFLGVSGLFALAEAAEKDQSNKGEVLVRENCGSCHAVGAQGESPNPQAPAFRTLSEKYPVESLAESLAEGIVSGHPEMPIFVFKAHDVDAIISYLEEIQVVQDPAAQDSAEEDAPQADEQDASPAGENDTPES